MSDRIKQVVMPKWGLSMREGKVTKWIVKLGDKVSVGDELLEVETEKIASAVEAGDAGIVRRILGEVDTVYPVKTLLAILADEDVPDSVLTAYGLASLKFGREYLIPKPLDPRVLLWEAPAVAEMAMKL